MGLSGIECGQSMESEWAGSVGIGPRWYIEMEMVRLASLPDPKVRQTRTRSCLVSQEGYFLCEEAEWHTTQEEQTHRLRETIRRAFSVSCSTSNSKRIFSSYFGFILFRSLVFFFWGWGQNLIFGLSFWYLGLSFLLFSSSDPNSTKCFSQGESTLSLPNLGFFFLHYLLLFM